MVESDAEREAFFTDWGIASIAGATVPGLFDREDSFEVGVSGSLPTFLANRATLAAASVGVGSVFDDIINHTGESVGSWRVAVWQPQDDGEVIQLQLERPS